MSTVLPSSSTSSGTGTVSTTNNAAPSATVTSTGIGSGLNISGIVTSLTTAYGAAQNNQLAAQKTSLTTQISAFGTFSSALSTLQATLSSLELPSSLEGFTASVADKSVATATATHAAVAGTYALTVQNLATPQILTSAPVASASTAIGSGTLTINVGGTTANITIDPADNTLGSIADAINSAPNNPGVTANIITTTDGARLVIAGATTGLANTITVSQSGGDGGLAALTYDPTSQTNGLALTQAPTDAHFTINSYPASSANNVVTGAISGVTLNLAGTSAEVTPATVPPTYTPTALTVTPDTSGAQTSIGTFVTALNGVLTSIQSLTAYDPTTQTSGPLQGNITLESFQNQLENILNTVTSASSSGGANSLATLGITANTQGTYDNNSTTVSSALSSNLTAVSNLLAGSSGIASKLNALVNQYTQPGGLLSSITQGLQTGLTNNAAAQTELNARLAVYTQTLTTEYNAMDTAVALLKQTQTYLTAEFNPNQASSTTSTSSLSSGTTNTSTG